MQPDPQGRQRALYKYLEWKYGRVVYGSSFENCRTERYRGFKSLYFRNAYSTASDLSVASFGDVNRTVEWIVGRADDGASLENLCTERYRGFESHTILVDVAKLVDAKPLRASRSHLHLGSNPSISSNGSLLKW